MWVLIFFLNNFRINDVVFSASVATSLISRLPAQSFEGDHRDRVCVCARVFIEMSVHACMSACVCIV
jgi:hypothetical protein